MVRRLLPVAATLAMLLVGWALTSCEAQAVEYRSPRDMFYNYYVPPGGAGGVGAELYLCPRPTPPLVGHTYVTYQPLMPHEFLYPHRRTYVRYNPGGGRTRTYVKWTHDWWDFNWLRKTPRVTVPTPICKNWHPAF